MSSAISKTVAAKKPVSWCLGLHVLLSCGLLISSHASAAAAVSVHTDQHSLSVAVNADDDTAEAQSSVSSQANDTGDEDHDHDEGMHATGNNQGSSERDNVQVFGDAHLQAGEKANNLVSVFGSSTNEGDVSQNVVSVLGNTKATGTVDQNAVAVLGNSYVNNKVGQNVVAVLGNVELGPHADIGQNVVAVGGAVKRDPGAIVRGGVQSIGSSLGTWFGECLFKGRLLAFDSGVIWAWWVALIALAVYALTALLFPRAVDQCVSVMEQKPGHVVLAGLLATVGLPIVIVLLCITIIGIIAIPFIGVTLMIAGFFGKVVMLAWIGRRLIKTSSNEVLSQPAIAVVIGGVIMMLLYTIPILSFLLYKVLGFLGIGVAVYALLLEIKSRRGDGDGNGGGKGATGTAGSSADLADKGHHAEAAPSSTADLSSASHDATALNELPRAGFWVRMVALMIDAFLIGIVTSMVIHPKWFGVDTDHVIVTLLAIYGAVMWKLRGATVGDIVFKLQVVRADGRPIDWPTAIIRSLGCFLSIMVIGLGFFWIAFDEHKQGWHDKIAGTLVVHNPKGISLV